MILHLDSPADLVAHKAGGKGANLYRMASAGERVPPFFVISTDAFERFVREAALPMAADDLEERILAAPMPADVQQAIEAAYRALGAPRVAVRSSALAEDSAAQSFAGQLRTFLHVESLADVIASVKGCWASPFSAHARAYMRQHGLRQEDARVAVVVQAMIDADVAGVAFTLDPVTGARDRVVISAVWGLGEGLVSGLLDADNFHVTRRERSVVSRQIAQKTARLVRAPGGGIHEEALPDDLGSAPALTDAQACEIAAASLALERRFGRPQDVEWALHEGTLYILQSRPVTTARAVAGPVKIWDNSNIVESYAGVTSPLTFTFARNAYYHVYVQFCDVMGVPRKVVEERDRVLRNMLGYLDGRIYYNLLNWYNLVGLFPGFRNNRQFMEGMMGVRESLPADAQQLLVLPGAAGLGDRLANVKLAARMALRFVRLRRTVAEFQAFFNEHYQRYLALDLDGKPWEELIALYREMDDVFLKNWKAPIINDFFAMVSFGLLKTWTAAWKVDEAGGLQNDLLCGEGGVESAVPTELLMEIAHLIRSRPAWRDAFRERTVAELRDMTERGPELAPIRARIQDYVARFGFRCMNELKLEEADLYRDPTFLYQTLKNYVSGDPPTVEELRQREQEIRSRAEETARTRLSGVKRTLYFWVLGHARETVKNRENLRLARTKVFGLVRRIMDAAGRDLVTRGALADAPDVYFLTLEELEGLVDGALPTQDLAGLVAIRKREAARFLAEEPDERFVTRGAPYLGNRFKTERPAPVATDGMLRGIGCCPGQVTASAKVITNPGDDMSLAGDILVARRTDPGWTPLFPSASGILVERGSLLSHSAIVARELGIPCVVGIPNLIDRVKTGDRIEMDGAAGWARIVTPEAPEAQASSGRPAAPSEG